MGNLTGLIGPLSWEQSPFSFWGNLLSISRRVVIPLILAVVLGVGLVGWFVIKPAMAGAERCSLVEDMIASNGGPVVKTNDESPKVAILGDSYTAGDGLDNRRDAWSYKIGNLVAGIGGTGFDNGGPCDHQSYAERVNDVLTLRPDVLIIQGGLNDVEHPDKVQAAASYLLDKAASVPTVIVVGPVDAPGLSNEEEVDRALSSAATKASRTYVSALAWELPFLPDAVHLTQEGHAAFASYVAPMSAKTPSR